MPETLNRLRALLYARPGPELAALLCAHLDTMETNAPLSLVALDYLQTHLDTWDATIAAPIQMYCQLLRTAIQHGWRTVSSQHRWALRSQNHEEAGICARALLAHQQWSAETATHTYRGTKHRTYEDVEVVEVQKNCWSVLDGDRDALSAVQKTLVQLQSPNRALRQLTQAPHSISNPGQLLQHQVLRANHALYTQSQDQNNTAPFALAVVCWLYDGQCWIAHVGTCRAYRLRFGTLQSLTQDHTLFHEFPAALTNGLDSTHPFRNTFTRALGLDARVKVEINAFDIAPGDTFLLCSSGLHKAVPESVLTASLIEGKNPQQMAHSLFTKVKQRALEQDIAFTVTHITDRALQSSTLAPE